MKTLSSREFRQEWTNLTGEVVKVTSRGRVIGHWVPGDNPLKWGDDDEYQEWKEASMDKTVKKAIEPEQVKVQPGGKLTKGLGEIPGVTDKADDSYRRFSPAPKPGTKK